jgi:hypothetical protein
MKKEFVKKGKPCKKAGFTTEDQFLKKMILTPVVKAIFSFFGATIHSGTPEW